MGALALDGLWLLAGLGVTYLIGVFTSQWAKDKINGVPGTLRAALKVTEAAAVKELTAARDRIVADTATLIAKGKAAAVTEIKARFDNPVVIAEVKVVDPAPAAPPAAQVGL